jgi:hypothetical protein
LIINEIIKDKIIIGHSLKYDFAVLKISPPESKIRDTAERFSWTFRKNIPSLKELAKNKLGTEIQTGTHDSKEDALAALKIFVSVKSKTSFNDNFRQKNTTLGITENHQSIEKENILRRAFVRSVMLLVILKNSTLNILPERITAKKPDYLISELLF